MRKFRFSLETVLKVRRQVEELRQRELADEQAHRARMLMHLAGMENDWREAGDAQQASRLNGIDLALETWYQGRLRGLRESIQLQRSLLRQQDEKVEAARLKAVEAARERRVLEKLEETQLHAWQKQANIEEQGFMDELAQRARQSFTLPAISADRA